MRFAQSPKQPDKETVKLNPLAQVAIEPGTVFPGGQYTFMLTLPDNDCLSNSHPFDVIGSVTPSSPEIDITRSLSAIQGNECKRILSGTISKEATGADITLFLMPKADARDKSVLGTVRLKVQISKGPGPIPPGLAPSLDLMWKVLPRKAVADSYGDRVADQYFAVEATFGNETEFDLQVAALGFQLPNFHCGTKAEQIIAKEHYPVLNQYDFDSCADENGRNVSQKNMTDRRPYYLSAEPWINTENESQKGNLAPSRPVDAYPIVRGTVEREQFVGRRAVVVI